MPDQPNYRPCVAVSNVQRASSSDSAALLPCASPVVLAASLADVCVPFCFVPDEASYSTIAPDYCGKRCKCAFLLLVGYEYSGLGPATRARVRSIVRTVAAAAVGSQAHAPSRRRTPVHFRGNMEPQNSSNISCCQFSANSAPTQQANAALVGHSGGCTQRASSTRG